MVDLSDPCEDPSEDHLLFEAMMAKYFIIPFFSGEIMDLKKLASGSSSAVLAATLAAIFILTVFATSGCGNKQENSPTSGPTYVPVGERELFQIFSFDGTMGNRYLAHFEGPEAGMTLYTHDEVRHLKRVEAASGEKFQDDRLMVWLQSEQIIFQVDGKNVGPCHVSGLQPILAKAWISGGDFWAVGNEPSWNLVMGRDRVFLITSQGETKEEFSGLPAKAFNPRDPAGTYVLANKEHELKVEIIQGLCTNTMSGEPFAVSVRLEIDGKTLTGCGTGLF